MRSALRRVDRHPRHAALAAVICGLVLAGHVMIAVLVAACLAVAIVTVRRRAAPLAVVGLAALVPAGALAGSARLAEIDRSELVGAAGRNVELVGHVIRRETVSYGVRRVRLKVTAYRSGAGHPWVAVEERVQVRS